MGRRAARGGFFCQPDPQAERSQLQNQMETLQNQLSAVKQRLETLNEEPQDN
jgi:ABC-type phosphate transport system auxiliary subunit